MQPITHPASLTGPTRHVSPGPVAAPKVVAVFCLLLLLLLLLTSTPEASRRDEVAEGRYWHWHGLASIPRSRVLGIYTGCIQTKSWCASERGTESYYLPGQGDWSCTW